MGLYNARIALVIVDTTIALPFCILMLKTIFDGIPREIDETTIIDGYSRVGVLFRVIVPSSWVGFCATGIFAFLQS